MKKYHSPDPLPPHLNKTNQRKRCAYKKIHFILTSLNINRYHKLKKAETVYTPFCFDRLSFFNKRISRDKTRASRHKHGSLSKDFLCTSHISTASQRASLRRTWMVSWWITDFWLSGQKARKQLSTYCWIRSLQPEAITKSNLNWYFKFKTDRHISTSIH